MIIPADQYSMGAVARNATAPTKPSSVSCDCGYNDFDNWRCVSRSMNPVRNGVEAGDLPRHCVSRDER
jgi:hypothetical protein